VVTFLRNPGGQSPHADLNVLLNLETPGGSDRHRLIYEYFGEVLVTKVSNNENFCLITLTKTFCFIPLLHSVDNCCQSDSSRRYLSHTEMR